MGIEVDDTTTCNITLDTSSFDVVKTLKIMIADKAKPVNLTLVVKQKMLIMILLQATLLIDMSG